MLLFKRHDRTISRRSFLQSIAPFAIGTSLLCLPSRSVLAAAQLIPPRVHYKGEAFEVALFNPNTEERIRTVFYAHGQYNQQSFQELCHFMRDHHQNATHLMDPALLTIIHDIQCIFDKREVHIISGYRTPRTNATLRASFPGVAKDSFHMKGQAADIRIPGTDTRLLRDVAKALAVGGVGYLPRRAFRACRYGTDQDVVGPEAEPLDTAFDFLLKKFVLKDHFLVIAS